MHTETLFHRPLPPDLVDFSAPEGRVLLREALEAGTAESFFPLMSRLHTQAEPEWCGLGTLVTVLNALEIDPGRVWKGPWRWFGEELLDCCKSLDAVRAEGLTLGELACLARCNGAAARVRYADDQSSARFLADLEESVRAITRGQPWARPERATSLPWRPGMRSAGWRWCWTWRASSTRRTGCRSAA